MTLTTELVAELERCIDRLRKYQAIGPTYVSREHGAAMRATLDATRALAAWRKVDAYNANRE